MSSSDISRAGASPNGRTSDSVRWSSSTTLLSGSRASGSKSRNTLESVRRVDWGSRNTICEDAPVDESQAEDRLQNLVDHELFRIERSNLPFLLQCPSDTAERVLNRMWLQLCFSKDLRYIIPKNQADDMASRLKDQASRHPVDLHAFCIEHDVSFDSVTNLVETRANRDWPRVIIDVDQHSYLCSNDFADNVKKKVTEVVNLPGTNTHDITSVVGHDVPAAILVALATEATAGMGDIRFAGDHVVYVPACFSCAEDKVHQQFEPRQTPQEDMESKRNFYELIETQLWVPLHLYAAGVHVTHDVTVRQDLEAAATNHFCHIVIPHISAASTRGNMLENPDRAQVIDQLNKAQTTIRSFAQLQTTVATLGDHLNLPAPDEGMVLANKSRMLSETCQSVQQMSRGIWILQNLIWILLATSGPGLFMSSMKYTSKMIQQYDAVGDDPEVAGMLNLWWDKVKDGAGNDEDLRQMKELAQSAVDYWKEDKA